MRVARTSRRRLKGRVLRDGHNVTEIDRALIDVPPLGPAFAASRLRRDILRVARCKCLQDGGRNLPIASLAPERHIGIDRRGASGGQVAGEKRGAD